jgi:hypothetical protein
MNRSIPNIFFILVFIFLISGASEPYRLCQKAVDASERPLSYSGVYKGMLDTFGVCTYDTAEAEVYFNFETSPVTIIYDGCVLEDYSYAGEVVYYTGGNAQSELGRFVRIDGQPRFMYKRILNHFYNEDSTRLKPFYWIKIENLSPENTKYKSYLKDFEKFKEFWEIFETAFFKKEFNKLKDLTEFPFIDNSQNPPVKISKKNFKKFITKVFNNAAGRINQMSTYKTHEWFPQRFGDHDPCFAGSYMWHFTSPRLNFSKVNGEYKLTAAYEYE